MLFIININKNHKKFYIWHKKYCKFPISGGITEDNSLKDKSLHNNNNKLKKTN